jgi:thiamine biosynthesis lipoprotein
MSRHHNVATFRAIGTTVYVGVRDADELRLARRLAAEVLVDVDEVCSRFRADSDLSRVNASPGSWVEVDPLLVAAVGIAVDAARQTEGLVHPLLGRPLVQLGYDRDFGELTRIEKIGGLVGVSGSASHLSPSVLPPRVDAWRQIALDQSGRLRIPAGTALDLGATGKAWAADLVATAYEQNLCGSAVISVGGDLRIANPDGTPWTVAVSERPDEAATLVALEAGGMATSTTQVRRWTRAGARRHHVIDPRTGLPAAERWRTVTATGATATAANTASTAAIVLGDAAPAWLATRSVSARLVAHDGAVLPVGAWPADITGTPLERSVA